MTEAYVKQSLASACAALNCCTECGRNLFRETDIEGVETLIVLYASDCTTRQSPTTTQSSGRAAAEIFWPDSKRCEAGAMTRRVAPDANSTA